MKDKFVVLSLFFLYACSPLRTSPKDEEHQLELTLHEVQTNIDDFRRDIHCFKAELQIIDGRIKHFENALANLKDQTFEKQQAKIEQIAANIQNFEKKFLSLNKGEELLTFTQEVHIALGQFKQRIQELEDELGKVKAPNEVYKVKSGDSLEKIAKNHRCSVEKIKKLNGLNNDLIVVGQELKIPQ